jgi:hypothetical protein
MAFNLTEGMRAGDLNDLILPLISVDEFESKISLEAVAIGFYVHDQEAAGDLNRFLQKSPVDLLSSEISPAPDQHGYYIIFIEMLPNAEIGRNVGDLLSEIEPLCGITKWKIRVRNTAKLLAFSPDGFVAALRAARRSDESAILDFLVPSLLEDVSLDRHGRMVLTGTGRAQPGRVEGFGPLARLMRQHHLIGQPVGVSLPEVIRCNRLTSLLGEGWTALEINRTLLIQHTGSDNCLLFRPD